MDGWVVALIAYITLAIGSFFPVAIRLMRNARLHSDGPSFDDSPRFSDASKELLRQNTTRINGTLVFWKTRAARFRAMHIYSLLWLTVSTVTVPVLAQAVQNNASSKWLVTVVSGHAAILLALVRAFRVESNYRSFRDGESDYYDLYRRMLDRPESFGETETEQLANYFEQVELVRRVVRAAETDNFPSVEDIVGAPPSAATHTKA